MKQWNPLSGRLVLTALVTPFKEDGSINWQGLRKNLEFQMRFPSVDGVVPVGTTGESPTLAPEEHILVISQITHWTEEAGLFVLAGCGSNSTEEAFQYTQVAAEIGCDGALLVDCYYNGPSSLELREEYYRPIAEAFPELTIVPYIIPGRTGCALLPEDLALLAKKYPNISAVKEATGDLERMRKTRELVPERFQIYSGDDDKTFAMMEDPQIRATGVISVISNIAPQAVQRMCEAFSEGEIEEARQIQQALEPLFKLVTVTIGQNKFRNPLPIKTMMAGLGIPAGPCRRPLGKMVPEGVERVRVTLRKIWENKETRWVLEPIEAFYGVNISARLADDKIWAELSWKG